MRIGIDARAATEVIAGRGRFVREVLRSLSQRDDEVSYLCYARERWDGPLDDRFHWRLIPAGDPLWHVHAARRASRECDVFLSTNSYLTTWMLRIPAVPVVYDMVTFDRTLAPNRRSALIERLTLGFAVRRSSAFIAISQATATDLERRFPASAGRVTVAPLGVAPDLAEPSAGQGSELPAAGFVLAVGTLEPRKNLPRLVAAYTQLEESMQRLHPLVVVGELGWDAGETMEAIRSLGPRCTLLGRVPDGALAELYRRCGVFCYPSLYEGFGLPVLEAMAAGAPVVTSNVSSLPEVGGDAVEYADPLDPASIRDALLRVLSAPERAAALGASARARARLFGWDRTAGIVLRTLLDAAR
jgi:glycosyltransferase involved in cell wall biosynthesis